MFSDEAFVEALRTVAAGGAVLDPEVISKLPRKHEIAGHISALSADDDNRRVLAVLAYLNS